MMRILIFLSVFFLFSCSAEQKNSFQWLEGTWRVQSGSDTGSVFHEKWWWDTDEEVLLGKGFEVQRKDTTWFESLSIEKIKNQWYYRAHVPSEHGNDTINFILLTKPDSDSLVFQNEENDFPAAIRYIKRSLDKLTIMLESSPHVEPAAKYILELERLQ